MPIPWIPFENVAAAPDTIKPFLAVINPTESIFVTSSYVNVPPIERLPDIDKLSKGPSNFVAVMIPDECILWLSMLDKEWIPGPTTLVNAIIAF